MAVSSETTPSKIALCVMLTNGDHAAGVLLYRIVHWAPYAHAKIPGRDGEWIANKRCWWTREVQFSRDQWDRKIARLEQFGLIERTQYWFGGSNILYVRPTKLTSDFVSAAKSWDAAMELLPITAASVSGQSGLQTLLKSKKAEPTSAEKPNSNENSETAAPGSAAPLNSKYS